MKIIRWAAVVPTLIFILLVWLFCVFLADPLMKRLIIAGGESIFGAKVDIASVRVGFRDTSLTVRGLQVGDKNAPMTNLFEIGETRFDARTLPLLEKKVIIDNASILNIRFGTARKTSAYLPPRKQEKPGVVAQAGERLWSQVETVSLDKFNDVKAYTDPKTVVNPDNLQVTAAARKAQEDLSKAPDELKADVAKLDAQKRADAIRARVDELSKGSNDVTGIAKKLEAAKSIQADIASLKADIENTKKTVQTRIQSAQALVNDVKNAKDADFKKLKETLSLPTLDQASLARALLGPSMARNLERVISLTESAKTHMPAPAQKPPPPQRGSGRVIEFPKLNALPAFLLIKSELTGEWGKESPIPFLGKLEGVTSNPPLYGKPAVLTLAGSQTGRAINARVVADLTQTVSRFGLQAAYNGLPIRDYALGQKGSIALLINKAVGQFRGDLQLVGNALSGDIGFVASGVQATPELGAAGSSAIAQRMHASLTQSISQVKQLSMNAVVSGTSASPEFKIQSNLGDILSGAMKAAVGAEFAQQEKALRVELDRVSDAKIKELSSQLDGLGQQFLGPLAGQNKLVDDLLARLQQQATGGSTGGQAVDKGLGAIKGLFGK